MVKKYINGCKTMAAVLLAFSLFACAQAGAFSGVPDALGSEGVPSTTPLPMASFTDELAAEMRSFIRQLPDSITPNTAGRTFFISADGDDRADGMSAASAWQSLGRLNEESLQPGDTVLLQRGSVFRGGIKVSCDGISYGAYGSGEKPEIRGARENAARQSAWSQPDASRGIWRYDTRVSDVGSIVFNLGEMVAVRRMAPGEIESDLDFYYDPDEEALYLKSSAHPASRFFDIEICERTVGIYLPQTPAKDIVIENIAVKYVGSHGIWASAAEGLTIRGCELGWIGGSLQNPGSAAVRYGNAVEVYNGDVQGLCVEDCYIYQTYDAGVTFQSNNATNMADIAFRRNLIEYCTYSIEYFAGSADSKAKNIAFTDNVMRFAGYGWGDQRPDKIEAAHIKSWNTFNRAGDFVIEGNYLDTSRYCLYQISSQMGTYPAMKNNTYIQTEDYLYGALWGEYTLQNLLTFGCEFAARHAKITGETGARVVMGETRSYPTVQYDLNSRRGIAPACGRCVPGGMLLMPKPDIPGEIFAGWNTHADGSGLAFAAGSIQYMPQADVTLYAVWG